MKENKKIIYKIHFFLFRGGIEAEYGRPTLSVELFIFFKLKHNDQTNQCFVSFFLKWSSLVLMKILKLKFKLFYTSGYKRSVYTPRNRIYAEF